MAFEQVHPAIHQAAWSAVGTVPGCSLDTIAFADKASPGTNLRSVSVKLEGWSPSLHRVAMDWRIPMDMGPHATRPDHEVHAGMLVKRMRDLIATQRRRAQCGLELGSAVPLRADGGAPSPCDHLHADASVLALMIERGQRLGDTPGNTIKGMIALPLSSLHTGARDYDGGAVLAGADLRVAETGTMRIVEPSWNVTEDRSVPQNSPATLYSTAAIPLPARLGEAPVVTVGGRVVMVSGAILPETAIAAADGRMVGEVADIHPLVARRRIARADGGDDWFALSMEPLDAPIRPLMNRGAHEALEILLEMLAGDADAAG
jgi:hypothetical protein